MESKEKEQPCGCRFDESIIVDVRGVNNEETINKFIDEFKEKIKNIKSNMLILTCQIVPTHFFDLD